MLCALATAATPLALFLLTRWRRKSKCRPGEERYAVVEAGGTSVAVAVFGSGPLDILEKTKITTGESGATLKQIADWLKTRGPFTGVGIASFGPVDLDKSSPKYGFITTTPKPGWKDTPIVNSLKFLNAPIGFDTDVNAAALSEAAHRGHKNVTASKGHLVYITVGTGVGVGIVMDGVPMHGLIHPEAGHVLARNHPTDTFEGVCPFHGSCIEGMVCNGAIAKRAGCKATELENIQDDSPIWEYVGYYLAQLCVAVTYHVSPHVIVLGGGIANRTQLYEITRRHVVGILHGYLAAPLITERTAEYIVRSKFELPGLHGGYELARRAAQNS